MDIETLSNNNRIYYCRSGSHAYGMNTPESDEDFKGVFIAEPENVVGLFPIEQHEVSAEITIYELKKFIKLAQDCNPNIIELLFTDPTDVLFHNEWWERIVEHRDLFVSKKAKHTFSGYAFAQLKRIKGHNKWINNPQPEDSPRQTDYVSLVHNFTDDKRLKIDITEYLEGYRLIPYDTNMYGLYEWPGYCTFDRMYQLNTVYESEEHLFMDGDKRRFPLFILRFNHREYTAAHTEWKQYWDWKRNRNVKRAELEAEAGYDSKHASHLIRLLRMGVEILSGKGVIVKRPDAEELLAIRNGKYTYDEILSMSESYESELNSLYETSGLQFSADTKKINELLVGIYNGYWSSKRTHSTN